MGALPSRADTAHWNRRRVNSATAAAFALALTPTLAYGLAIAGSASSVRRIVAMVVTAAAGILIYHLVTRSFRSKQRADKDAALARARERSRAKDELIASISHELRTPLTSIYGFSEHLLDSGFSDPAEVRETVGFINEDSLELSRMVDDLLTAARLDSHRLLIEHGPVDVLEEAQAVVAPLRRFHPMLELRGTREIVMGDAMRIRQIIRNLVSNALVHGGPNILVVVTARNGMMSCRVTDDGIGPDPHITRRLMADITTPGSRSLLTENEGLGLAIAASLTRRMGGSLDYAPDGDRTTFAMTMPLAPPEAWAGFQLDDRSDTADERASESARDFSVDTANSADAPPSARPRIRFR